MTALFLSVLALAYAGPHSQAWACHAHSRGRASCLVQVVLPDRVTLDGWPADVAFTGTIRMRRLRHGRPDCLFAPTVPGLAALDSTLPAFTWKVC